jgi:hypothetical protein
MAIDNIILFVVDLADKLKLLDNVKKKLVNNQDEASKALREVVSDLRIMFEKLDDAIVDLLSLSISKPESESENRKVLYSITGERLKIALRDARTRCGKIDKIYREHLSGWFPKILNPDEQMKIDDLFSYLGTADDKFIQTVDSVEWWLRKAAESLLTHLDQGDFEGAKTELANLRANSENGRKSIRDSLLNLQQMEADFS